MADYTRRIDESLAISDSSSTQTAYFKSADESLSASDPNSAQNTYFRSLDESATVIDTSTALPQHLAGTSDSAIAYDTKQCAVDFIRSHADAVTLSDVPRKIRNLKVAPHADTVTVSDSADGKRQYPGSTNDTVSATDAGRISVAKHILHDDSIGAVDSIDVQLHLAEGKGLVLFPNEDGYYSDWDRYPTGLPSDPKWEVVSEIIVDNTTYVYVQSNVGDSISFLIQQPLLPVACPLQIVGLNVEWMLTGDTNSSIKPLFRLLGSDWVDPDPIAPLSVWAPHRKFYQVNPFTGRAWHTSDLLFLEVGLYNNSVYGAKLSRIQVDVVHEATPASRPRLTRTGYYAGGDWSVVPDVAGGADALLQDDGGRSYVEATVDGAKFTSRTAQDRIPEEFQIDHVSFRIRAKAKNAGETGQIKPLTRGEGVDRGGIVGDWIVDVNDQWCDYEWPFPIPPQFDGGRWTKEDAFGTDWGFELVGNTAIQVTSTRLAIYASLLPNLTFRLLPEGTGLWSNWLIGAPNLGESPFQDINTYTPNDNSYIIGNAEDPDKRMRVSTFPVSVNPQDNWYGIRWQARVAKSPTYANPAHICPVLLQTSTQRIWFGREFVLNSTIFAELGDTIWTNPFTGKPWVSGDLGSNLQVGIAILEGVAYCSQLYLDASIVPPRSAPVQALEMAFTTDGLTLVAAAIPNGVIWKVDAYEVGIGGYDEINPQVVRPIVPDDATLEQPIYEGTVDKTHFEGMTAYYWCAIPPNIFQEPIGEIRLLARILDAGTSGYAVGEQISLAKAHFPCGFHTARSIRVIRLALEYS